MEAETPQDRRTLNFEFRGKGDEYFRIWIVNLLLSIATLGIYSAWATVRTNRYFHSSLYLDNVSFQYHGKPLPILISRLIAAGVLVVWLLLSWLNVFLFLVAILALYLAAPFITNRSLAFRRHMSAYRNVRFHFRANYGDAFKVMYIWPLLGGLTLGILAPLAIQKWQQYLVKNSAYGTTRFHFTATYGDYAGTVVIALGTVILGSVFLFLIWSALAGTIYAGILLGFVFFYLVVLGESAYLTVAFTNLLFCRTHLQQHHFEAKLEFAELFGIVFTNSLLILVTLGLYFPVARIRTTRYICDKLVMKAQGSLEEFSAAEGEKVGPLGEALGDAFDISA